MKTVVVGTIIILILAIALVALFNMPRVEETKTERVIAQTQYWLAVQAENNAAREARLQMFYSVVLALTNNPASYIALVFVIGLVVWWLRQPVGV